MFSLVVPAVVLQFSYIFNCCLQKVLFLPWPVIVKLGSASDLRMKLRRHLMEARIVKLKKMFSV